MAMTNARDDVYDKPIAYEEDDKIIYRASALGMCPGALVRARLGVTPSAPSSMMQERFQEGHDFEAEVVAKGLEQASGMGAGASARAWQLVTDRAHLEAYAPVVEHGDGWQMQTELIWSNKIIRCHPDGLAIQAHSGDTRVIEAKFLSEEFAWDKIKKVEKMGPRGLGDTYAWQLAVEMLSMEMSGLYIIGMKELVEREDGEREVKLGAVWTLLVDEPPFTLKEIKARVLEIEGYVARGEMPTCPLPLMYPCGYWADHEVVEREEVDDDELEGWVLAWQQAARKHGELGVEVDGHRAEVARRMGELGLVSARVAQVDVSMVSGGQGNVSWAKWAAEVKRRFPTVDVNEDEYRGKAREGYVKLTEVKE